jgi:dihydrofolate synthase/folylpolyglutamate synthase
MARRLRRQAPRPLAEIAPLSKGFDGKGSVLTRLAGLHPKVIDLSLDRILRLLDQLGRPQDRLPPVVHVAGTNGKGSVIAFLRAMLEAAGLSVHVYTSPHLVRFNERIVVAGSQITDESLTEALSECERINAGAPITFFEITTAAAMLAFSRTPADLCLLETGLGGRLDATNVIRRPALTAITPIGLDHQAFLGTTLGEIAGEKAGILKPGVSAIVGAQRPEAEAVIRQRAADVAAPLLWQGEQWTVARAGNEVIFVSDSGTLNLPLPALLGPHQVANAGLAIACVQGLRNHASVGAEAIIRGLQEVHWPARLQRLSGGRLSSLLPDEWELWLDGGHNPLAGQALAGQVRQWRDRPVHLVFGMLRSKDATGFLKPLAPFVASLVAVAIAGEEGSLDPEEAAGRARAAGIAAETAADVAHALEKISSRHQQAARVLICGSLYLAGQVLEEEGPTGEGRR